MPRRNNERQKIVDELAFYLKYNEDILDQSDVDFYIVRDGKRYRVFVEEMKEPPRTKKHIDENWANYDAGRNAPLNHNGAEYRL
jgi:hypothetical protein